MTIAAPATMSNIATSYSTWISEKDTRIAAFETNCPLERGTTYYFAQAGDDTEDGLTEGTAKKTLAEAQVLHDAAATDADMRLRFNRGDEWDEAVGLIFTKDNITVDAYGTGDKPLFNCFYTKYLASANSWTLATGNRWSLTEALDVAWIRETADRLGTVRGTHVIRQDSAANVAATDNSFWWDSGGTELHINLAGDDPNDHDLEVVFSNVTSGLEMGGDGCRVEDIRADGWGMHRTNSATSKHGIVNTSSVDDANLFKYCDAHYGTSHCIAHRLTGAGGRSMFIGCKAGYTIHNGASAETICNTYSSTGGQETWFLGCDIVAGTLRSSDWTYAIEKTRGTGFFCHSAGTDIGLVVVFECSVKTNTITQAAALSHFLNNPAVAAHDLTDNLAFCVNSSYEARGASHFGQMDLSGIIYGCKYYFSQYSVGPQALCNTIEDTPYIINTYIDIDVADVANTIQGLINTSSGDNTYVFVHSTVKLRNPAGTGASRWGIDYDVLDDVGAAVNTLDSRNAEMYNSIIDFSESQTGGYHLAVTNQATSIIGNAYFEVDDEATFERGYDNDAEAVALTSATTFGTKQSELVKAGSIGLPAALIPTHDINGTARIHPRPDIGPEEFEVVIDVTSNLLFHFKLDEPVGGGTNPVDETGNHTATITEGTGTFTSGEPSLTSAVGKSNLFAGDARVNLDSNAGVAIDGDMTISCFVKFTSLTAGATPVSNIEGDDAIRFFKAADDQVHLVQAGDYTTWTVSTGTDFVIGQLYHFALTRLGSGNITFWVDAVPFVAATADDGTLPFDIGRIGGLFTTHGDVEAGLDEVRFYSRALSSAEIKQLRQGGLGTSVRELDPAALKASYTDGANLNPSLTTSTYTGGVPTIYTEINPGLLQADGTLNPSMSDGKGNLKPNMLK